MFAEIMIALALGVLIGILTGLIPGIHVNLIAASVIIFTPTLLQITSPLVVAVFILALAITHSFLDTIPSIYLGVPENENALAILPGQKMLLQGDGHLAVTITILGTFMGMIIAIMLSPLFIMIATTIYHFLKPYVAYLLMSILIYLILKDQHRFMAFFLFLLSGLFGVLVFSLPSVREPLFPMLSGIFGLSGMVISYLENAIIPPQKIRTNIAISPRILIKALIGSSIAVFLIQFFPGMGPTQGAALSGQIIKDIKDKTYMALIGAMGTMSVIFSLTTFYALGKAKDGSIVAIQQLISISGLELWILLFVFAITGGIATLLTLQFSRLFAVLMSKINYKKMIIGIMLFVLGMVFIISGWLGLLICVIGTTIGLLAPLTGTNRSHAMGCLLFPVILYYVL